MACCADAAQLIVYLDTDNNSATGCTVTLPSPPGGSFAGAERVLTTTINTATNPPTVSSITQQNCVTPPSTLSAPAPVSPGGWSVGVGLGVGGFDFIEPSFPAGPVTGTVRVGFLYTDPNVPAGGDALLTVDGSANGGPITIL